MENALNFFEITFTNNTKIDAKIECSHYEVRPDDQGILILSMFLRDFEGKLLNAWHYTKVTVITVKGINLEMYEEYASAPTSSTIN